DIPLIFDPFTNKFKISQSSSDDTFHSKRSSPGPLIVVSTQELSSWVICPLRAADSPELNTSVCPNQLLPPPVVNSNSQLSKASHKVISGSSITIPFVGL